MGVEFDRRKVGDVAYLLHFALHHLFGDEYEICLLYLVFSVAVARSDQLVPLPDPQAVFVGFFDLGELLEEYLRPLLFQPTSAQNPEGSPTG